jgi:hypothetical protein
MENVDTTVYSLKSSWGPCASTNPWDCKKEITILKDGTLFFNGKKMKVSPEELTLLEEIIQQTDILNKECSKEKIMDKISTYTIYKKSITNPSCGDEIKEIDSVVSKILESKK